MSCLINIPRPSIGRRAQQRHAPDRPQRASHQSCVASVCLCVIVGRRVMPSVGRFALGKKFLTFVALAVGFSTFCFLERSARATRAKINHMTSLKRLLIVKALLLLVLCLPITQFADYLVGDAMAATVLQSGSKAESDAPEYDKPSLNKIFGPWDDREALRNAIVKYSQKKLTEALRGQVGSADLEDLKGMLEYSDHLMEHAAFVQIGNSISKKLNEYFQRDLFKQGDFTPRPSDYPDSRPYMMTIYEYIDKVYVPVATRILKQAREKEKK